MAVSPSALPWGETSLRSNGSCQNVPHPPTAAAGKHSTQLSLSCWKSFISADSNHLWQQLLGTFHLSCHSSAGNLSFQLSLSCWETLISAVTLVSSDYSYFHLSCCLSFL